MGICHFISEALDATTREDMEEVELLNLVMECGNVAVKSMAILDKAHCESYGDPLITKVKLGTRNNPGILISGHDMLDLEELLKQTEGTGVDVYTHGEMLPGHYYPEFRNTSILSVIMVILGGSRVRSLKNSMVRSYLPPIVLSLLKKAPDMLVELI